MQLKLPSPEQIYDLSTDQLSKLKFQLEGRIKSKNSSQQQVQELQQLLQNIELQIQERKTIQYFTELCVNDGTADKMVKEITDFNNQFKKLANQLLNKQKQVFSQSNTQISDSQQWYTQKQNHPHEQDQNNRTAFSQKFKKTQTDRESDRHISETSITSEEFSIQSCKTTQNYKGSQKNEFTKSNATQMSKIGNTTTKKIGFGHGSMKKSKNAMQQFIKATLSKSKAIQYVSSKGGTIKKSPQQKLLNNGSHVNTGSHLSHKDVANTPISTNKSIKSPLQGSDASFQRSENKRPAQSYSSNKTASAGSNKSLNQKNDREQLMIKRNDAIQKMKKMKNQSVNTPTQGHPPHQPPKKKNVKGLDLKSMVQMVKLQQQAKRKRQEQPQQPNTQTKYRAPPTEKNTNTTSKVESNNNLMEMPEQIMNHKANIEEKSVLDTHSKTLVDQKKGEQPQRRSKQSEFPIKEQINAILSQSDTQSDSEGAKLIGKSGKKLAPTTRNGQKPEYYPIPEEQIEESTTYTKEETIVAVNRQMKNDRKETYHIQTKDSKKPSENDIQPQSHRKVGDKQIFGKITQEEYNPNCSQQSEQQINDRQTTHQQTNDQQKYAEDLKDSNEYTRQQKKKSQQQIFPNLEKAKQIKINPSKKNINGSKQNNKSRKHSNQMVKQQFTLTPSTDQLQSTKIYNEEYWLHIKQEAEAKIQRFKQEKDLQRRQREMKDKMLQEESKKVKIELQKEKNKRLNQKQSHSQNQPKASIQQSDLETKQSEKQANFIVLEEDEHDKFIQKQKNNLKKIYSDNGTIMKTAKKPTNTVLKQPKIAYPKPDFNYLQIFPTFNHIFNVFFTKPQGQALLDIPLVMKQLIQMFQTHIQYQKSRTNNFRPAIFLAFDNRNSKMNQFNDARLLLQHAQTTYVNLKTLVQRVQIFNSNVQGEFENSSEEERQKTQFYRVVKTKEQVYDIITTSFLRRKGWKELPHGQNLKANWNLFWSWSKPDLDMNKLLTFQRINHFPFNKNLCRKDLLYKNIDSFRKTHKVAFPFLPLTFNLPKQFTQFSKKFHEQQLINRQKNYWIMKPIGKSRGRGIKLINSLGDLNYLDNIVVQKYIANPLLIDGYKFDMRIYVLVTSFHPLEAFVYREGFARLSTEKYSLQPMDMKNNFVHLTNFAINKHNHDANEQFSGGSKISIKSLKQKVTKMGYSFASVWSQVHEIIIKSLLACSVTVPPFPGAFQLFGYDVMMDQTGQCHLIQINASPSLQRSFLIDQIIKQSLIDDIIQIVNPPAFSKQQLINVMNERLAPDFRNNKKGAGKMSVQEEDLIHLARIMKYQKLRKYGQMPEKMGLFQMVAPSPMSKSVEKLIKSKSGINAPHNID